MYNFADISPKHVLDLFDKLVTPILNYGGEVWGFCKAKQIERVHLQFCKHLLGVKQSTQNNFVYGDFGRTNYQTRRYINIVKFWLMIIFKPDNKVVTVVYNQMKSDFEGDDSKINWVVLLQKLLCDLGFHEVWLQQRVGDVGIFLSLLKQRALDHFRKSWHSELQDSSRAVFYRIFLIFIFKIILKLSL